MQKLSTTTIKLISSSQVITSVYAAVKELVENSIDAQATSIEVRLVSSVHYSSFRIRILLRIKVAYK